MIFLSAIRALLERPPQPGDRVLHRAVRFEVVAIEGHGVARCRVVPGGAPPLERALADAILGLNETERTVVLMRYHEGRSASEIARVLRVPAGTVRWRLKTAGYRTALLGKWHLGTSNEVGGNAAPNRAGWQHHAGSLGGQLVPSYTRWQKATNGNTQTSTRYATTDTVDDAIAWIRQQGGNPWLAMVAFNAPHEPLHAPPASLHGFDLRGVDCGGTAAERRTCWKAMVAAMDTEIGRLVGALGSALANTTIVFVGDNGTVGSLAPPETGSDHGKGTVFEGGVRVPLIVKGPGVVGPGRRETALVQVLDLFATVAELAGVDPAKAVPAAVTLDTVSLVPYLRGQAKSSLRSTIYTETFLNEPARAGSAAIRDARYKLIRERRGDRLYDLTSDPRETTDLLSGTPSAAERRAYQALDAALKGLRGQS